MSKPNSKTPPDLITKFKELEKEGLSAEEIGKRCSVSGVTVRKYLYQDKPKRHYNRTYLNVGKGTEFRSRETEKIIELQNTIQAQKVEIKELRQHLNKVNAENSKLKVEKSSLTGQTKALTKEQESHLKHIEDLTMKHDSLKHETNTKLSKIAVDGHRTKKLEAEINNEVIKSLQKQKVLLITQTEGGNIVHTHEKFMK